MATSKMIRCQICGASMRKQRMEAHIEKVHISPGGRIVTARPVQAARTERPQAKKSPPKSTEGGE